MFIGSGPLINVVLDSRDDGSTEYDKAVNLFVRYLGAWAIGRVGIVAPHAAYSYLESWLENETAKSVMDEIRKSMDYLKIIKKHTP
jgi:hypothetical protein